MKSKITILVVLIALIAGGWMLFKSNPDVLGNNGGPDNTGEENPGTPSTETFLRLGISKTITGVTITPIEVVEDSRCAEGVQCIWAGRVVVKANFSKPSGNFTENIELGKSVDTGTEKVELVAVSPAPKAGVAIIPSDYRFEFKVTQDAPVFQNPVKGGCYVGGCSGQICSDEAGAISTCEYREAYACYKSATCERQGNGQCGWTPTTALQMCLNNAR